jgi:hypothetical protein
LKNWRTAGVVEKLEELQLHHNHEKKNILTVLLLFAQCKMNNWWLVSGLAFPLSFVNATKLRTSNVVLPSGDLRFKFTISWLGESAPWQQHYSSAIWWSWESLTAHFDLASPRFRKIRLM